MDLGKNTVLSDSPEELRRRKSCLLVQCRRPSVCNLLLPFILDDTCARRSPSCAKMKPANPTMKGLEL